MTVGLYFRFRRESGRRLCVACPNTPCSRPKSRLPDAPVARPGSAIGSVTFAPPVARSACCPEVAGFVAAAGVSGDYMIDFCGPSGAPGTADLALPPVAPQDELPDLPPISGQTLSHKQHATLSFMQERSGPPVRPTDASRRSLVQSEMTDRNVWFDAMQDGMVARANNHLDKEQHNEPATTHPCHA